MFPFPNMVATPLPTVFNPLDKSASAVLSNANKTLASSAGGFSNQGARSLSNHASGAYHVEFKITESSTFWGLFVGFATAAASLTGLPAAGGFGISISATTVSPYNGASSLASVPMTGMNGATIAVDIDLSTNQLWFQCLGASDGTRHGPYSITAPGAAIFALGMVQTNTQTVTVIGDRGNFLLSANGNTPWG